MFSLADNVRASCRISEINSAVLATSKTFNTMTEESRHHIATDKLEIMVGKVTPIIVRQFDSSSLDLDPKFAHMT